MVAPYFEADGVTLYLGDCREILPTLSLRADLVIADPPYAETSLAWDRWPSGWPALLADYADSMWCFGSMRMFLDRRDDFAAWKLSQDVVWEKHNGSGFAADRFKRVHEIATHWYRGDWAEIHHDTPTIPGEPRPSARIRMREGPGHQGAIGASRYEYGDTRLARSVIYSPSMHKQAVNETQKPEGIVEPLARYGCPRGGLVLDPFAGSGTTGAVAKALGMRAVLIEFREEQCEHAANRLSQACLDLGALS